MRRSTTLLCCAITACGEPDKSDRPDDTGVRPGDSAPVVDADGDGFSPPEDCDDVNPEVHPGALEICDEIDNDCDGSIDPDHAEGATVWYLDADGDGFGDPDHSATACSPPSGYVADAADCDDSHADVHPDGAETCADGVDQDCDGLVDCEDGDCVDSELCVETDCTDGLDDDLDGLADCDDDDCWGVECHPAGVLASVHSGRGWNHLSRIREPQSPHARTRYYTYTHRSFELWSVTGTIRVLPAGAVSWGSTGARDTCAWAVDQLSFEQTGNTVYWGVTRNVTPPVRAGVAIEPGCRIASSWFLPDELWNGANSSARGFFESFNPGWFIYQDLWYATSPTGAWYGSPFTVSGNIYQSFSESHTISGDGPVLRLRE